MSELAVDSVVDEGQAEDSGVETTANSPQAVDMPEMGQGIFNDEDLSEDLEATDEHPTTDAEDSPATADEETKLTPAEIQRREQDRFFTQKNEALISERKAFEAEREAMRQEMASLRAQQPAPQTAVEQAQNDAQTLRQHAAQATDPAVAQNLNEQAAGLEYVQAAIQQGIKEFSESIGLDQYGKVLDAVGLMRQQAQEAETAALTKHVDAAIEVWGKDAVSSVSQRLSKNLDMLETVNPATGNNWTMPEMVGWLTGKTQAETTAARQAHAQQRGAAKKAAAPRRGTGNGVPAQGQITKAQALADDCWD